jgi:Na+-driven multidrug efflux pump
VGQAAATLIGQYLGLGDVRRAWQAVLYCWMIAAGLMSSLGVLFFLFAKPLVSLVSSEPRIIMLGAPLLMICAPAQLFLGTAMVLEQAVRGAGDTRPVALLVAGSTYLVRLPLAYLLGLYLGWGVSGIWIALCSENALRGSLIAAYFLSGRWQRTRV